MINVVQFCSVFSCSRFFLVDKFARPVMSWNCSKILNIQLSHSLVMQSLRNYFLWVHKLQKEASGLFYSIQLHYFNHGSLRFVLNHIRAWNIWCSMVFVNSKIMKIHLRMVISKPRNFCLFTSFDTSLTVCYFYICKYMFIVSTYV